MTSSLTRQVSHRTFSIHTEHYQRQQRGRHPPPIVAEKIRKWKGRLLDVDLNRLRQQLEASRDFIFSAAKVPQNLFPDGDG